MNKMNRQWKATADVAMAPVHFDAERGRVALEIAARLAVSGSQNLVASAGLQNHVLSLMEDTWLRASLAARHLDTLEEHARAADYEDARAVDAESRWTLGYLAPVLQGPLARRLDLSVEARLESFSDLLYAALTQEIAPRLQVATAA